jgi:methylmalonyl-CoA/ethylmalonyl-CoA epimerase
MIKRIDHVSIAVRDLDSARKFFTDRLGGTEVYCRSEEAEGFRWTSIVLGSSCGIELVDPVGEDSFLDRFLDQRGDSVHHVTIQVDNAETARDTLEARGVPTFGYNDDDANWKHFYVHPKNAFGVLLQFAEFEPKNWGQPEPELELTGTGPLEARRIDGDDGTTVELSDGISRLRLAASDIPDLIRRLEQMVD